MPAARSAARKVHPSRHKCLIYDGDPSEQLPVIVPLLCEGLRDNWRCLYIGSPQMVSMIEAALRSAGIDVVHETKRGSLVLSSERNLLSDGAFDPHLMLDGLRHLIDTAVRDGFKGLCATGDMSWELAHDRNFERLLEYEALLEQLIQNKPLRGICQYHRDLVPAQAVRDALMSHRSAFIGGVLNVANPFYTPPEVLLSAKTDVAKQVEWMCQQVIRAATQRSRRPRLSVAR